MYNGFRRARSMFAEIGVLRRVEVCGGRGSAEGGGLYEYCWFPSRGRGMAFDLKQSNVGGLFFRKLLQIAVAKTVVANLFISGTGP
jgi:hypothetical protein